MSKPTISEELREHLTEEELAGMEDSELVDEGEEEGEEEGDAGKPDAATSSEQEAKKETDE